MNRFATTGRWLGAAALMVALAVPALAQRNVTLRLNTATLPDTTLPSLFNPDASGAGMQLRGGLESGTTALPDGNTITWDSGTTLVPTNVGGDYWEIDFQIPNDDRLNFKFFSQQAEDLGIGGWEDNNAEAGTNDFNIPAGTGDVTLDLHYFNKAGDQLYDWRPFSAEGDSIAVWFRVYMNTEDAVTRNDGYDPEDAALMVGARGNFATLGAEDADGPVADWGDGGDTDVGVRLTRESDDSTLPGYHLYSGVAKYPAAAAGETAVYKFYFSDTEISGDAGYENGNDRTFTVPTASSDTTLHWVYFSNDRPTPSNLVTSNITFTVDVAPLTSIGLFNTGEDAVQVRGGFNGWDCPADNQDDCLLTQLPISSLYTRQFPFTSSPGAEQNYKYYVDFQPPFQDPQGNTLDIGWEEPLDYGGANRPFTFAGTPEQNVGPEFFNNIRPGNVIDDGASIELTFTVDMSRAVNFAVDPFLPAEDTVSVRFEDNVWLLTQGYEPGSEGLIDVGNGQAIPGFKLTDPDGDLIYTGVLTVTGPTYNGIGYNYFYSSEQRSGVISEGVQGFEPGRRRYRYITDTDASAFSFGQDTFKEPGASGEFVVWEVNPTGDIQPGDLPNSVPNGYEDVVVANEQGPGVARGVALSAPRPNPTRGRAEFGLSLERSMAVNAQVVDLMGRTVAVLAEGTFAAGETTLGLDTSALASGVYVVRIQAGNEVVTRRMTVVR